MMRLVAMTAVLLLLGLAGCSKGDTLMERLTGDPPSCDGHRKRAINRDKWDWSGRGFAALAGARKSCG